MSRLLPLVCGKALLVSTEDAWASNRFGAFHNCKKCIKITKNYPGFDSALLDISHERMLLANPFAVTCSWRSAIE